jgi:hypothetical protein
MTGTEATAPAQPPPAGQSQLPPRQRLVAAYVVAILFLFGMMIFLVVKVQGRSSFGCPPGSNVLPDQYLLIAALWALVVGRWLGGRHFRDAWKDPQPRPQPRDRRWQVFGAGGYVALTLVATLGLFYEAVGVQQESPPQLPSLAPITQYTRCAIYYDIKGEYGVLTYAVLIAICLLLGSWLWADHPSTHFADATEATTP